MPQYPIFTISANRVHTQQMGSNILDECKLRFNQEVCDRAMCGQCSVLEGDFAVLQKLGIATSKIVLGPSTAVITLNTEITNQFKPTTIEYNQGVITGKTEP